MDNCTILVDGSTFSSTEYKETSIFSLPEINITMPQQPTSKTLRINPTNHHQLKNIKTLMESLKEDEIKLEQAPTINRTDSIIWMIVFSTLLGILVYIAWKKIRKIIRRPTDATNIERIQEPSFAHFREGGVM